MSKNEKRNTAARRVPAKDRQGRRDPARDVHPAFQRYLHAVDDEVGRNLTGEEVDRRLVHLLRAHAAEPLAAPPEDTDTALLEPRAAWAAFGRRAVVLWLTVVSTVGDPRLRLTGDAIDEITVETVARALSSLRDESPQPELIPAPQDASTTVRTVFLSECVRHLPYVHECHWLMSEDTPFDGLDDQSGTLIVPMLWQCATKGRAHTLHRLGLDRSGHVDRERRDILKLTPAAIRSAAARYPDAVDPASLL
ncbi:hypothetical protein AB0M57_08190 [Streptomyces sp. NPDC051597]|uniref:hypothetical protein n=1 Tax=Streptomyces sp. NPDC051597 TaxID=3155049 RepID=UPI00342D1D7F